MMTGQGDWADWPIFKPVGIVQTTAACLPGLDWENGYRSICPRVDLPNVDPPQVRPNSGRSAPVYGIFRPCCSCAGSFHSDV